MTMIIDPPISIYSSFEEIIECIELLQSMPDSQEVRDAIDDARRMLKVVMYGGL